MDQLAQYVLPIRLLLRLLNARHYLCTLRSVLYPVLESRVSIVSFFVLDPAQGLSRGMWPALRHVLFAFNCFELFDLVLEYR